LRVQAAPHRHERLGTQNAELREQVGLLSSDFSEKGRVLRSSARSAQEGGLGVVESYKEQALTEIEPSLRKCQANGPIRKVKASSDEDLALDFFIASSAIAKQTH